jgi:hypothetical protein
MNKKTKTALAAGLGLLAIVRLILWITSDPTPPEASRHYEVLGWKSAELMRELVGPDGRVLMILTDEPGNHLKARKEGFEEAAKQGPELVAVVRATAADTHPERGLNQAFYRRIAEEYPDIDGILSFAGTPPLNLLNETPAPTFNPKFVAVIPYPPILTAFLQRGLIHLAITPSPSVPEPPPELGTSMPEWFDAFYRVTSPASNTGPIEPPPPLEEYIDDFVTPQ